MLSKPVVCSLNCAQDPDLIIANPMAAIARGVRNGLKHYHPVLTRTRSDVGKTKSLSSSSSSSKTSALMKSEMVTPPSTSQGSVSLTILSSSWKLSNATPVVMPLKAKKKQKPNGGEISKKSDETIVTALSTATSSTSLPSTIISAPVGSLSSVTTLSSEQGVNTDMDEPSIQYDDDGKPVDGFAMISLVRRLAYGIGKKRKMIDDAIRDGSINERNEQIDRVLRWHHRYELDERTPLDTQLHSNGSHDDSDDNSNDIKSQVSASAKRPKHSDKDGMESKVELQRPSDEGHNTDDDYKDENKEVVVIAQTEDRIIDEKDSDIDDYHDDEGNVIVYGDGKDREMNACYRAAHKWRRPYRGARMMWDNKHAWPQMRYRWSRRVGTVATSEMSNVPPNL
jgi:hypothetical protein